eukprot:SAG31_NODE_6637_length_1943_cov_1.436009_3_plen_52_part_01
MGLGRTEHNALACALAHGLLEPDTALLLAPECSLAPSVFELPPSSPLKGGAL